MKTKETKTSRKLLRAVYPKLYDHLLEELMSHNIHSYDVQITFEKAGSSVEIQVRFGERFTRELTRTFSEKNVHEIGDAFHDFCEEIKQACKETLIADYFKMVKP
ncbi:hypothetical protein [Virgibacillus doumboii]|uniref:hypothetical protein n=1 Tax=Virgibacillus doumboii TaxID=2697503 RepID=UPI0013E0DD89|nr:hypothetical protein [Virgibacillus doumboii]